MYISQSFYHTPIMIRKNIGYLIIKKLSSMRDLARIIADCSLTETKEEILKMYKEATKNKFGFLLIDLQASKYYQNFELIKDCNNNIDDTPKKK